MIRFRSLLNITILLAALAITVAGYVLIPPGDSIAIHWGFDGNADGFLSRDWALLQMPAVIVVIWAIFWGISRWFDTRRREASAHLMGVALSAVTALMAAIQGVIVLLALGYSIDVIQVVAVGMGVLQIVLGNAMPKSQPNAVAGIRIPTTLRDPANWQATHRLTGVLLMIGGLLLIAGTMLFRTPLATFGLIAVSWLLPLIIGTIYSIALARRAQGA
jgi:uncharacterized membrane protein